MAENRSGCWFGKVARQERLGSHHGACAASPGRETDPLLSGRTTRWNGREAVPPDSENACPKVWFLKFCRVDRLGDGEEAGQVTHVIEQDTACCRQTLAV